MAPPTSKLRLNQLVPELVAEEVAQQACAHVESLLFSLLSPTAALRIPEGLQGAPIYTAVRELAYYAIHGRELDAGLRDYMVSLIPLYRSACGGDAVVDGLSNEADPETSLGLVIRAACARERILLGEPVSAVDLGVLAGLSDRQVRQLIRAGEIPAQNGLISAKSARRFLAARKVRGYVKGA